jgi:hypothetical protein
MNDTSWNAIEKQIKNLGIIEQQIEKVRILLAEDWHFRTSRPEIAAAAPEPVYC